MLQQKILMDQKSEPTERAYFCDKVSNQRDVCVAFFPAGSDIRDDGKNAPAAQQMDHSIKQSLLQVQLRIVKYWNNSEETSHHF